MPLRDQWIGHKKAREQLLANALRTADEWIAGINDPEGGAVGQGFLAEVTRSGCGQEIDIRSKGARALYTSFSYGPKEKGFVNRLVYGPSAEEDIASLFSSKVHEATHALQKMKSAALHASPFNPNTKIIICPRDWVTLNEHCEQDAYTKQAWFNTLLAHDLPEARDMADLDSLSVEDFEAVRARNPDLASTLVDAARHALDKSYYTDNPDFLFKHHYQDSALKDYEAGMNLRRKNNETNLVFVRLEPEDITAIGASFGPNSFGENGVLPEFLTTPWLEPDALDKLCKLNNRLGITNDSSLPTLGQVLTQMGLTRVQFIAASYQKPVITAGSIPAGPG